MKESEIRDLLLTSYTQANFVALIRHVFAKPDFFKTPQALMLAPEKVEKGVQLGRIVLADGKTLAFFDITLNPIFQIAKNRVELRNMLIPFVDQDKTHAVLAAFHSEEQDDFRLSFVSRQTELDAEGALQRQDTPPKRFTFVCGPLESCATAAKRLAELATKASESKLKDVLDAFSVEKLNREFFEKYKEKYGKFVSTIAGESYRRSVFRIQPENKGPEFEKPIRDWVKLLLGRIVFLHFLQKKGWLGCPAEGKDWTGGNRHFLRNFFEEFKDKDHFHSKGLSALFFETLNEKRKDDLFRWTKTRIPYLNGGLFDEDFPKAGEMDFPERLFKELFDFFGEYNFTIDENSPEDHDVGIDPEMLGRIFENLLEDNKEKGVYYTPKSVVQYMCQESLFRYLITHLEVPSKDAEVLGRFVRAGDKGSEKDKDNWIRKNAKRLEEALDSVKICDPAIGSGAFPIGMMQEILRMKLLLDWTLDKGSAKKRIIQHSIYGVDKEKGAVDIARLRFWLALVVDEDEPQPLPNLDFKIMQGDSLLESFLGISLKQGFREYGSIEGGSQGLTVAERNPQLDLLTGTVQDPQLEFTFTGEQRESLVKLMNQYFDANRGEKLSLHRQIDKQVTGLIDRKLLEGEARIKAYIAVQKKHLEANLGKLKTKTQKDKYRESGKEAKRIKEGKDDLEIIHRGREQVESWDQTVDRPFFLWHLFFGNVLKDGGFDIVIANPPYVRQELIKQYKEPLKKEGYACYDGVADLFVYFFEKGVQLLKPGGSLCFICSNKYFRAGYGENLRKYLGEKTLARQIIDFGDAEIFDATAYPSIVVLEKAINTGGKPTIAPSVQALKWKPEWGKPERVSIQQVFSREHFNLAQTELKPRGWIFESREVLSLMEKLRKNGTPLGEYVNGKFYRGVLTGLNEAFVVDRFTRDRLITEHKSSEKVLKPFLRGKDVKRWRVDFDERYLIKIGSSENEPHSWSGLNDSEAEKIFAKTYPAIYAHFRSLEKIKLEKPDDRGCRNMWEKLQRRDDQGKYFWELRSCVYYQDFEKPKIIYPDIYEHQSFAWEPNGFFMVNTCYFIPADEQWLCGLLNSHVTEFFYGLLSNRIRGGYLRAFSETMQQIPIPKSLYKKEIGEKVTKLSALRQISDSEKLKLEAELDALIANSFGMTQSELELVLQECGVSAEHSTLSSDALGRLEVGSTSADRDRRPIENFAALPDGVWANPQPDLSFDETLALTAILKSMDGPKPIQHVRLAALLVSNPRLLTPRLSADTAKTWRRLIGSEAAPLGSNTIQFVAPANQAWGNAVGHQRGNGRLIEDLANNTWAPGEGLNAISTVGWADGRARMVMSILGQYAIEQLIQQLPEQAQRWIYGAAA